MILSIQLDSTQVVQHLTNATVTYDLNSTTVNPRRHYAILATDNQRLWISLMRLKMEIKILVPYI